MHVCGKWLQDNTVFHLYWEVGFSEFQLSAGTPPKVHLLLRKWEIPRGPEVPFKDAPPPPQLRVSDVNGTQHRGLFPPHPFAGRRQDLMVPGHVLCLWLGALQFQNLLQKPDSSFLYQQGTVLVSCRWGE